MLDLEMELNGIGGIRCRLRAQMPEDSDLLAGLIGGCSNRSPLLVVQDPVIVGGFDEGDLAPEFMSGGAVEGSYSISSPGRHEQDVRCCHQALIGSVRHAFRPIARTTGPLRHRLRNPLRLSARRA